MHISLNGYKIESKYLFVGIDKPRFLCLISLWRYTRLSLKGYNLICLYLFVGIDSAIYVCYNGGRGAPFACGSLRHKIPTRKAILWMAKSIRNANKLSYLMQRVKRRVVSIRRNKLRCSLDAHGSMNYWKGVEHLFDSREFVLLIGSSTKIF